MITGQMADATGLIEALEKEGYNGLSGSVNDEIHVIY